MKTVLVVAAVILSLQAHAGPRAKFLTSEIDLNAETVAAPNAGNDLAAVMGAFEKNPPPSKSQLETTAEFRERVAVWFSRKLIGEMGFLSTYAFSVAAWDARQVASEAMEFSYDADAGVVTITMRPSGCPPGEGFAANRNVRQMGSYVARNAFNRTVKVRRSLISTRCINIGVPYSPYGRQQVIAFKAPVKTAERIQHSVAVLLIGRLALPYYDTDEHMNEATLSSPEEDHHRWSAVTMKVSEIWVYDRMNGAVYHKERGDSLFTQEQRSRY